MEIVNDLPEELYLEYDEFLAYVGIYDDKLRIERYKKFIKKMNPANLVNGYRAIYKVCRV